MKFYKLTMNNRERPYSECGDVGSFSFMFYTNDNTKMPFPLDDYLFLEDFEESHLEFFRKFSDDPEVAKLIDAEISEWTIDPLSIEVEEISIMKIS